MNIHGQRPSYILQMEQENKGKQRPYNPRAAADDKWKEVLFLEGVRYNAYALQDNEGNVNGWRIRERQINPDVDVTNSFEDFMYWDSDFDMPPFDKMYETYKKGEEAYAQLLKEVSEKHK